MNIDEIQDDRREVFYTEMFRGMQVEHYRFRRPKYIMGSPNPRSFSCGNFYKIHYISVDGRPPTAEEYFEISRGGLPL